MEQTETRKFNYGNMPLRDRQRIDSFKRKHEFINALPELVQNNMPDYRVFFLNITFKETRKATTDDVYKEYFKFFRRQLDHKLLSHPKHYAIAPKLILVPEDGLRLHFHGFVLIHQYTYAKFEQKCVLEAKNEYIEKLDETRKSLVLQPNIINPYPDPIKFQNLQNAVYADNGRMFEMMPILTVADYKLYHLPPEDIHRTAMYCTKNLLSSPLSVDQVILENKMRPNPINRSIH